MLEYMGNEGVGSEEIDKFMGWMTVDMGDERLGRARDRVRSDTNSKVEGRGMRARQQEKRNRYAGVKGSTSCGERIRWRWRIWFNLVTADCGPSREPARPEDALGRSKFWFSGLRTSVRWIGQNRHVGGF